MTNELDQHNTTGIVSALIKGVTLVAVILILGYCLQFGGYFSPKQEVWAQFGDYLGGLMNPVIGFAGLIGILFTLRANIIAIQESRKSVQSSQAAVEVARESLQISQVALTHEINAHREERVAAEQSQRRTLVVDMLKIWMSPEMQVARGRAWDFIRKNLSEKGDNNRAFMGVYRHTANTEEKSDFSHVATVYHYFAEIHALLRKDLIDSEFTWELIGRSAQYWLEMLEHLDFREHESDISDRSAGSNIWYESEVKPLKNVFQRHYNPSEVAKYLGLGSS